MKSKDRSRSRGWTLIEMMIVMAILAALLALAYPAYSEQMRKARRADGKQMLLDAAQRQQQYYTTKGTFASSHTQLNLSSSSSEGYYTLDVTGNATTYTLTAVPAGAQTSDTKCGSLTINHLGTKSNTGSLPASKCW